jgi:hypothetical protein
VSPILSLCRTYSKLLSRDRGGRWVAQARAKLSFIGLLLVGACAVGIRPATAQTYTCQPTNSPSSVALKDYAVRLTGGDPSLEETRQLHQLPTIQASKVTIIKTNSICQQAAQAYNKAVRGASAPPISRSVSVVKIGTTRYLVIDPAERAGEYEITVIFDAAFAPLSSFNS